MQQFNEAAASHSVMASFVRTVALAASPGWLLWGGSMKKHWPLYQTTTQALFFLYLHPSSCCHSKPSCRHQPGGSFHSVHEARPEVSRSGLRVPAGADCRWGPGGRWKPGIHQHYKWQNCPSKCSANKTMWPAALYHIPPLIPYWPWKSQTFTAEHKLRVRSLL